MIPRWLVQLARYRTWRRHWILLLAIPFLAATGFHALVAWWPYPADAQRLPLPSVHIQDRNGLSLAAFAAPDGRWRIPLSLDDINPHLVNALVAVEDARFYRHHGVDWVSVIAAAAQDLRAGRLRRGGSTITMQLHRLRHPAPRGFLAKLEQSVRAAQIEQHLSKDRILLEYLNRAPFGGNLVGAGAASWRYFKRPCNQLSLGQSALLAGLPQSPSRYRPDRFPQRALARRRHVLDRMLALGFITPAQRAEAAAEPLDVSWQPLPQARPASLAADGALPSLAQLARRSSEPSPVSTIDAHLQRQAFETAQRHLDLHRPSGVSALALVLLDTQSAETLALVSLSAGKKGIDLTRCARSTGSALKPFIYAAAFEAGVCTPGTILRDSPAAWPGYAPSNIDGEFRGGMTAAAALAASRNIPALLVLNDVGPDRAAGLMGAAGLRTLARTPSRYGLSLAVGGAEASPFELAEAYATLGRGGIHRPATLRRGRPLPAAAVSIFDPKACRQTLAALADPARTERLCPEAARRQVAWKTGTSSANRDAWCAAVTPRYTVVVWMGNPTGPGAQALVGVETAAPLALQLIASLDASAPLIDNAPDASPLASSSPFRSPVRTRLTILSPIDKTVVVYNPDIPRERQQVLFRAMITAGAQATAAQPATFWWFVDGQPLGSRSDDEQLWWNPTPGAHEIRVVDATGRARTSRIRVE